jgi:hypothetical protein
MGKRVRKRYGLVHAKIGHRFDAVYRDGCKLRGKVEAVVETRYGEVSLWQVARIQTFIRTEASVRIAEMTIRDNPEMSVDELRQYRHSIVAWSRERDNLLRELIGDGQTATGPADPWAFLSDPVENVSEARRDSPEPEGHQTAAGPGNAPERILGAPEDFDDLFGEQANE